MFFFVNFRKNTSEQQKILDYLYVAHFDEKKHFFDLKELFFFGQFPQKCFRTAENLVAHFDDKNTFLT